MRAKFILAAKRFTLPKLFPDSNTAAAIWKTDEDYDSEETISDESLG